MKKFPDFSKYLKKDYWNLQTVTEAVLFLLALVQFLFLVYINLVRCRSWIDHDASMLYSHTIHMWEQKKFVLPFYSEETFLHIDTSCLFAMPLYGLTKDIFLSYGLSNVIFLVLTLYVIWDIMKQMHVRKAYAYAALLLYMIPYRMGMLQYTAMLFYECSFYNVCILVPLLAIDLLFYEGEELKSAKYKILFAVCLFFTALTAFSRGSYVLLVALLPVVLCYVLEVVLSKDGFRHIRRERVILIVAVFASYFAGMLLGKVTGYLPKVSGYSLVMPREIFNNFTEVLWGHFSIFVDRMAPEVISADGIKMLISLGFSFFALILIIFNLKNAFGEDETANHLRYLTVIYIWNCIVCGLTACSDSDFAFPERYLLPGIVPVLISVPVMLSFMEKIKRPLLKGTLYLACFAITMLTVLVSNYNMMDSFRVNAEELKGIREVLSYARDNGLNTVFFLDDDNAGLISRSLDPTLKVVSIQTAKDGSYELRARENYMCAHDRAFYDDENLLAVTWDVQPEEKLTDYLLSSYQYVGDVESYHLYRAGSNKFDDRAGFPLNDRVMNKSIDLCHTKGYQTAGTIDLYGYLETTGNDNFVLISPLLDAPYAACDVTLSYETGHKTAEEAYEEAAAHEIGQLQILNENLEVLASSPISSSEEACVVPADPTGPCYIAVKLNEGEKVTLHDLTFQVR
ncbi:MAG: hypothetical protein K6D90_11520 [Lachnospiraceae bacterium]|nr:hypothetical protein [Lachnospiraceae bacterium]